MKSLPYGIRRVSEIAAKLEAARASLCTPAMAPIAPIPAPNAFRCIKCHGAAVYMLCNDAGKPLPRHRGGFCLRCAPEQGSTEETPSTGIPATLQAVEAAARERIELQEASARNIEALRTERATLAGDLATMLACSEDSQYCGNGPSVEEIKTAQVRMTELDEMLIFDNERPFILGFDDLPASYFAAQTTAQDLAQVA